MAHIHQVLICMHHHSVQYAQQALIVAWLRQALFNVHLVDMLRTTEVNHTQIARNVSMVTIVLMVLRSHLNVG
jgi:hypothetical protein